MLRRVARKAMAGRVPAEPLIVVLGATGTGKSELAVSLATKFNGEVINGDAMQMYSGIPIITNKISAEEQKGIPHHLLGVVGLDEETWRVGVFKTNASRIISEIRQRGKLPILVGGTHYYTQSLLCENELVEGQDARDFSSEEIVARFPVLAASTEEILSRLREVDPRMADRWHPKDRRKIQRSLEIFLTTGKQASQIYMEQRQKKTGEDEEQNTGDESMPSQSADVLNLRSSTLLFWVHADDSILKRRLDARVDNMINAGLLEEVKKLNDFLHKQESTGKVVDKSKGIWVSIGYKEFEHYLTLASDSATTEKELAKALDDAIERTKGATRRYAKRQIRWIRLRLVAALLKAKSASNLYLLDGSDISHLHESVSDHAIRMTSDFLAGLELPVPTSLSSAAKELLDTKDAQKLVNQTGTPFRQECNLCHMIAVNEIQWSSHLKSRTHRRMTRTSVKRSSDGRPESTQKDLMTDDSEPDATK